jgi:quercetin dioxygenase-like cupin family protein
MGSWSNLSTQVSYNGYYAALPRRKYGFDSRYLLQIQHSKNRVSYKFMNQTEWEERLQQEGYNALTSMSFEAHAEIKEHSHFADTVQVILEGELTLFENNEVLIYAAGDRFLIPSRTTHHARVGSQGCQFLMGWKNVRTA